MFEAILFLRFKWLNGYATSRLLYATEINVPRGPDGLLGGALNEGFCSLHHKRTGARLNQVFSCSITRATTE